MEPPEEEPHQEPRGESDYGAETPMRGCWGKTEVWGAQELKQNPRQ